MDIHVWPYSNLFNRKFLRSYFISLILVSSLYTEPIPIKIVKPQNIKTNKLLVVGNIPFSEGEIFSSDNLKVVNTKNIEMPSQVSKTVAWPDKSIMLATIIFVAETNQDNFYYVVYGKDVIRSVNIENGDIKNLTKTSFIIKNIRDMSSSVIVEVSKTANLKYYFYLLGIVIIVVLLIWRKISFGR